MSPFLFLPVSKYCSGTLSSTPDDTPDCIGTVDTSDISGHYDDPLLPVLIHLRQSELPDSTSLSVSKGLLQQTLESAVWVHSGHVLLRPKNELGNLAKMLKYDHHFMNASKTEQQNVHRCIATVATSPARVFTGYGSTNEAAEVSEWVSSFLTAHQHNIGYAVAYY